MCQYVIRCDESVVFSGEPLPGPYSYLELLRISAGGRRVFFNDDLKAAVRFGSWDEAAAVAVFIIQQVNSDYEEALEVVKIDS